MSSPNPYVGPRPFEFEDKHLFFGRVREIADLKSLVIAHPTLVLYAESGAGKSSLINAGIRPRLQEQGFDVLPSARVRGALKSSFALADVRNVYVLNALLSLAGKDAKPEDFAQQTLAGYLQGRTADSKALATVLVFDQFEELFTSYSERWNDRREFFRQLAAVFQRSKDTTMPLVKVIIAMREDYIARLDTYLGEMPDGLRNRFRLERLRKHAAVEAVRRPLENTPRSYAEQPEDAAERLVKELLRSRERTESGETKEVVGEFVEPVQLQVVCSRLWDELPADTQLITADIVDKYSNVDNALREFYEAKLKAAIASKRCSEERLRQWIEKELITPGGTRGTVFEGRSDSAGMPNEVVRNLAEAHLLRADWRSGGTWYEIAHDRFIDPILASNRDYRASGLTRAKRWASVGGLAVLLFVAVVAYRAVQESRERAQLSAFNTFVQTMAGRLQSQPDIGLLMSVAAYKAKDTPVTRGALLGAVLQYPALDAYLSGGQEPIAAVALRGTTGFAVEQGGNQWRWALKPERMAVSFRTDWQPPTAPYSLSADASVLALLTEDATRLVVWTRDNTSTRSIPLPPAPDGGRYHALALSGDAQRVAIASKCAPMGRGAQASKGQYAPPAEGQESCPGAVTFVQVADGRIVETVMLLAAPVAIAMSYDGAQAVVGFCESAAIQLQQQRSANTTSHESCDTGRTETLDFGVVASTPMSAGPNINGRLRAIAMSKGGKLALASDTTLQVFDTVAPPYTSVEIAIHPSVRAIAFDEAGAQVIAGTESGLAVVYSLERDRPSPVFERIELGPSPSEDSKGLGRVRTAGRRVAVGSFSGGLFVFERERNGFRPVLTTHTGLSAFNVALSPDGTRVAVAHIEDIALGDVAAPGKSVIMLEAAGGGEVGSLFNYSLACEPAQEALATDAEPPYAYSVAIAGDGRALVGTSDGRLGVWTASPCAIEWLSISPALEGGEPIEGFDPRAIVDVAFSPSGKRFAGVAVGGKVLVGSWGPRPSIERHITVRKGSISLSFANDEASLFIGTVDQGFARVRLDTVANEVHYTTEGLVVQIAVDPVPARGIVALTSTEELALIDDTTRNRFVSALQDAAPYGVAISEDGSWLYVSPEEGPLLALDLTLRPAIERACSQIDPKIAQEVRSDLAAAGVSLDPCADKAGAPQR